MDYDVEKLVGAHELSEEAVFILDSIAYQLTEGGKSSVIGSELGAALTIAKRYQKPVEALKLIDRSVGEYLRRWKNPNNSVGSLTDLNELEGKLAKKSTPTLRGLETRIESDYFGIAPQRPLSGMPGRMEDDAGPWQSNAIRALEGN